MAEARLQRAPSTISLSCASCRRRVTPCIVCAHLLPCCSCCTLISQWVVCRKCKVKNLLMDHERRLLGFPPISALSTATARRVVIAYIGRAAFTIATHLQHQQIQQALAGREEAALPSESQVNVRKQIELLCQGPDVSRKSSSGLPFVLHEGVVTHFSSLPGKESASSVEIDMQNQMLLEAQKEPGVICNDCGGACASLCLDEMMAVDNEAALRRCEEQLVALHCAGALSADLNSPAYPLCDTVTRPPFSCKDTKTCDAKVGFDCSSGLGKGVSCGMLRMVTLPFVEEFDIWLAEKGAESQEIHKLEDVFTTVEAFFAKHDHLLILKNSFLKAVTAQEQVSMDGQVGMPRQSLQSTVSMLEKYFAETSKDRMQKLIRAAEQFGSLLSHINLILEFLYACAPDASSHPHSTSLCTAVEARSKTDAMVPNRRHPVENLRMAISSWLLLYHDVAHAVSVI